jgi:pimeloyl-ACP methyl ester carboxylesterase
MSDTVPPAATSAAPAAPDNAAAAETYQPLRHSTSRWWPVRQLRYHVRTWGDPGLVCAERPALVLAHGWMDVGASFQFLVDALAALEGAQRHVVALDWRGFGGTEALPGTDCFWFPDYLADLDALLDALQPTWGGGAIDLLGHSMGGVVVMSYAAARPERIRKLANLEGFGMPQTEAAQAPARARQWLDELKTDTALRSYASLAAVAARLMQNNPRLAPAKAAWLAPHWSRQREDGRWHILGHGAHKRVNPVLYRQEEAAEFWRRVQAPVLSVEGADTAIQKIWGSSMSRADFDARLSHIQTLERTLLADCGHMMHHDQPEALAARLLQFLSAP